MDENPGASVPASSGTPAAWRARATESPFGKILPDAGDWGGVSERFWLSDR
jgi:hypothetical protein